MREMTLREQLVEAGIAWQAITFQGYLAGGDPHLQPQCPLQETQQGAGSAHKWPQTWERLLLQLPRRQVASEGQ